MTADDKKRVQDLYDDVGWKTIDGVFVDTLTFADRRPVASKYFERIHRRVRAHLVPHGRFILDAASGPIPHPEQSIYSEGFDVRICLDFSFAALQGARAKLGRKGLYILADVTRMPLRDGSVDAVVSAHTLYHVPADEQETALREIYRVLKPAARAVVVYSWGQHSALMRLLSPRRGLNRRIAALLTRRHAEAPASPAPSMQSYAHFHPYSWFRRALRTLGSHDIACWRSVDVEFQRAYIHDWLLGREILAVLAWMEERFPSIFGRLGQYPMFVIRKTG